MREVECNTELTEYDKQCIAADDSIIAIYHGSKGGIIRVHDNFLRTLTPEQVQKNIDHMYDVANQIVDNYCRRMAAEEGTKNEI